MLAPLRVPATLFLSLAPMERSSFLYPAWHDLRRLAATGRWAFSSKDSPALVEQVLSDRELVSHQEPPGPELIRPAPVPSHDPAHVSQYLPPCAATTRLASKRRPN